MARKFKPFPAAGRLRGVAAEVDPCLGILGIAPVPGCFQTTGNLGWAGQSSAQPWPGCLAGSRPAGVETALVVCHEFFPGLDCLPGGGREEWRWPALERGILFILPEIALLSRPQAARLGRGTGGCSHLSLPAATSPALKWCPPLAWHNPAGTTGGSFPPPCRDAATLGPSILLSGEGCGCSHTRPGSAKAKHSTRGQRTSGHRLASRCHPASAPAPAGARVAGSGLWPGAAGAGVCPGLGSSREDAHHTSALSILTCFLPLQVISKGESFQS